MKRAYMIKQDRNGQNAHSFRFAIDEAKALPAKVKGCMSKTKNTTKAGHFNINRRTWWFVFHPCMIRETHHMALVSSSLSKGHILLFFSNAFIHYTTMSSTPTSSTILIGLFIFMHNYRFYQTIQSKLFKV